MGNSDWESAPLQADACSSRAALSWLTWYELQWPSTTHFRAGKKSETLKRMGSYAFCCGTSLSIYNTRSDWRILQNGVLRIGNHPDEAHDVMAIGGPTLDPRKARWFGPLGP